ncbi:MAG: S8 family serine peptidase [Ichthyobacteriaceae bacterium]|nr:S8 family serine peptidase [Ichthyobacteriaceae bacterium]
MKKVLFAICLLFSISSYAQINSYAIYLNKKDASRVTNYINNPTLMLTQRAIDRRVKLKIPLDAVDVPINKQRITYIKNTGATILENSKWLNVLYIEASDAQLSSITKLNFVKSIKKLTNSNLSKKHITRKKFEEIEVVEDIDYNKSETFVKQIKTNHLHNKGFLGEGILIAIMDAGFPGVNTVDIFKELRDRNGIKGTYNFVLNEENVYQEDHHGTYVLSCMAVNKPGTYVGTAPMADYWLFQTENNDRETPMEEFNWVKAAEFADSVGVDVINTSLGYYDFDAPYISYTQADMDGKTTFITKAAEILATKGVLTVLSAGNEGRSNNSWGTITAPADANGTITVGAVYSNGGYAEFTSPGPTYDGRIKPNISAMGVSVPLYNENGSLRYANGTSFSSPILAGSVACLRQAFPNKPNSEIISALQNSGSIYENPSNRLGYGIADLEGTYDTLLNSLKNTNNNSITRLKITPNPVENKLIFSSYNIHNFSYTIYSSDGKTLLNGNFKNQEQINVSNFNKGCYYISIWDNKHYKTLSFIKM